MKKILVSIFAASAMIAPPAAATTFPSPRIIYFVSGITDSGDGSASGVATTITCTNFSGASAHIVFSVRSKTGAIAASKPATIGNLTTVVTSTHNTNLWTEDFLLHPGVGNEHGSLLIYSNQSAVFCSATIASAGASLPESNSLHLVRFNAHPGTVE